MGIKSRVLSRLMLSPAWNEIKVYLQHATCIKRIDLERAKRHADEARSKDPEGMEEAFRYAASVMNNPSRELTQVLNSK